MRVKLEKKLIKLGEYTDLPDYSYNHYYNLVNENECIIYYLVPQTLKDAYKAIAPKSQKEIP